MKHQAPSGKQWLCRHASQAIGGGQATKQNIGGSLKVRCFCHCDDDEEVAKECENTERYIKTKDKKIVHVGPAVIVGEGNPDWQTAYSGSVDLIGHSLITMTTVRTENGEI